MVSQGALGSGRRGARAARGGLLAGFSARAWRAIAGAAFTGGDRSSPRPRHRTRRLAALLLAPWIAGAMVGVGRAEPVMVLAPEEVYEGFDEQVIRALGYSGDRVLVIGTNVGGYVDAANAVARFVYWQGITVRVVEECVSACTAIALASRDLRMAPGAVLGFHSWYVTHDLTGETLELGPAATQAGWDEERETLLEFLLPAAADEILRLMKATPPDDVVYLDAEALREIGVRVTVE